MANCPVCGEDFSSQYEVDVHVEKYHDGGAEDGGNGGDGGDHQGSKARLSFCVAPDSDFNKVRNAGINVIQTYELGTNTNAIREYLNEAQVNGLKVLLWIGDLTSQGAVGKSDAEQWQYWNSKKDAFIQEVNTFKDHSALWGWYWADEINASARQIPLDLQQDVYNTFKQIAPDIPVVMTSMGSPNLDRINFNALDILMPCIYPYPSEAGLGDITWTAQQLQSYLSSNNINTSVMPVVQAANVDPAGGWQGHIADQIAVWEQFGFVQAGLGMWAWGDNVDGGADSDRTLNEIASAWSFEVDPWVFDGEPPTPPIPPRPPPLPPEPIPPTPPEPPDNIDDELDKLGTKLVAQAEPYLGHIFPERPEIKPPESADPWGQRPYEATWPGGQQQTFAEVAKEPPSNLPEGGLSEPHNEHLGETWQYGSVPPLDWTPPDISGPTPWPLGEDFYSKLNTLGQNLILSVSQNQGISQLLGG